MDRVIKFRAWCSGTHGSLTFSENSMDYNVVLSKNGYWCNVESGWDIQGEYETVPIMQFTGMKDCNGKEIYEGDIIEGISNSAFDNGGVSNYEVMWGIDHWHINGTNFTLQELFNYCNNKIKVVGNIYETPNLYLKDCRTNHGTKNAD